MAYQCNWYGNRMYQMKEDFHTKRTWLKYLSSTKDSRLGMLWSSYYIHRTGWVQHGKIWNVSVLKTSLNFIINTNQRGFVSNIWLKHHVSRCKTVYFDWQLSRLSHLISQFFLVFRLWLRNNMSYSRQVYKRFFLLRSINRYTLRYFFLSTLFMQRMSILTVVCIKQLLQCGIANIWP